MRHMRCIGNGQIYISIDTASGIPAASLFRAVYFDCDHVLGLSVTYHIIGDIKGKCIVTIVVVTDFASVYIDRTVCKHAAKIKIDAFSFIACRQHRTLAIPADSGRQCSLLYADLTGKIFLNTPVMRQIQFSPG